MLIRVPQIVAGDNSKFYTERHMTGECLQSIERLLAIQINLCYAKTYSSHNMKARMRTPYRFITNTLTFSGFSFQPAPPTSNKRFQTSVWNNQN